MSVVVAGSPGLYSLRQLGDAMTVGKTLISRFAPPGSDRVSGDASERINPADLGGFNKLESDGGKRDCDFFLFFLFGWSRNKNR